MGSRHPGRPARLRRLAVPWAILLMPLRGDSRGSGGTSRSSGGVGGIGIVHPRKTDRGAFGHSFRPEGAKHISPGHSNRDASRVGAPWVPWKLFHS